MPATYYAFDLLGFEGFDLRPLPLVERKRLLQRVLPRAGPVRFLDHVAEQGEAFYAEVEPAAARGPDRQAGRRAVPRRPLAALAEAAHRPRGRLRRRGLHRAAGRAHRLRRAAPRRLRGPEHSSTAAGPAAASARSSSSPCARRSRPSGATKPACTGPLPTDRGHVWVEPRRVAEVRYLTWTAEGLLRQPVFLRLRDDKRPDECPMPARHGSEEEVDPVIPRDPDGSGPEESAGAETADPSAADATGAPRDDEPVEKKVPFTNLEKVFWPDEGYTKGDLIEYYRAISPWLLPYLKDRLLVLTRFPDGIKGKSFFQKDAPSFAPGWVRLERVWSESAQREIDYFVARRRRVAPLHREPRHDPAPRLGEPDHRPRPPGLVHPRPRPEDGTLQPRGPGGAGHARAGGRDRPARLREDRRARPACTCSSRSAGCAPSTSAGSSASCSPASWPAASPRSRRPSASRTTGAGASTSTSCRTATASCWPRPSPRARSPAPRARRPSSGTRWTRRSTSARFTIRTLPERMSVFGRDPLAPVLTQKPDLVTALARLAARLEG